MQIALKYADAHWRIDTLAPSVAAPAIWLRRHAIIGPCLGYFPTEADANEDKPIVLDFWDRASWRDAYRHARVWSFQGIGGRALQSGRTAG